MRVLLASDRLVVPGGSETYLLTLGRQLQRFGHDVVAVEGPGGDGSLPDAFGLASVRRPSDLPEAPDRAIVQDAVVAGEVAAAWPDTPQLLVMHSGFHDVQIPANLPSSTAALVALNDRVAARARAMAEGRPVHRLTQPVDVGHFTLGPPPAERPQRLLLFGNNAATWRSDPLRAECARRGIEVEAVGRPAGNIVLDPVQFLRQADIVVGYGRCVLEAMACGRTAFVFDRTGSDGWVTADTYADIESSGFCGASGLDVPGRSDFADALDAYDHRTGAVGHDLAFRHHDARTHAVAVVELLEGLGPVEPADPATSLALARTWREQWRWERQALAWSAEVDQLRTRHHELEVELAAANAELARLRAQGVADADERARLAAEVEGLRARLDDVLGSRRYRLADAVGRTAERLRRLGGAGDAPPGPPAPPAPSDG